MDLGSFSPSLTNAIKRARELAQSYYHAEITPFHFFLALIREEGGGMSALLKQLEKKPEYFEALLADELSKLGKSATDEVKPVASPAMQSLLMAASSKAEHYSDSEVGAEHVLMVFCTKDEFLSEGIRRRLQFDDGQIIDALTDMKVVESIAGQTVVGESGEAMPASAEGIKYCTDLTEVARSGKLDNFFGREEDIYNISRVLIRRRKNNPILVGPPGVGKSALIEGLALKIVNKETTPELHDSTILSLDLGQLVAGAKYKGEFEERFNNLISKLAKGKGNLILFVDEVHTLVGAGNPSGGMDAANLIKPVLARGGFKLIGATTTEEYKQYIEKDKALDRRFQRVMIDETTYEETKVILTGVSTAYGEHHKLKIPAEVIEESIRLSQRYIGDRFLPDKAIDLLDEAAASFRLNCTRAKNDIPELQKKSDELKNKLGKAYDSDDTSSLSDELAAKLEAFNNEFDKFYADWEARIS